jgi:hypothetical protein
MKSDEVTFCSIPVRLGYYEAKIQVFPNWKTVGAWYPAVGWNAEWMTE